MSVVSFPDPSSISVHHRDNLDQHGREREREPVNIERDPKLKTIRQLPKIHYSTTAISVSEKEVNLTWFCSTCSNRAMHDHSPSR